MYSSVSQTGTQSFNFRLKMGENHNLDLVQGFYFALPQKQLICSARDTKEIRMNSAAHFLFITKILVASAALATEMSEKHSIVGFSTLTFRKKRKMPDTSASRNNVFQVKFRFLRKLNPSDLMTVLGLETLAVPALG